MRRCFTAVALLIFASSFAFSTANVSGKLVNPNPSIPLPVGSFARFELRNCGGNYPQVSGASVTSRQDFPIASDGTWSGLLSRNDEISCNGSFTTYWTLSYFVRGIQAGPSRDFSCSQSSCVFDGTGGLTPITVYPPPTPPAQPLTGAESVVCSFPVAASTWTCTENMGTQQVVAEFFDSTSKQIFPDQAQATDVNTFVGTFLQPQTGFMRVVNVGNWTPSSLFPNYIISNAVSSQTIGGPSLLVTAPTVMTGGLTATAVNNAVYIGPNLNGAKCDGVTDDTTAFNSAVTQAMALGKALVVTPSANGCLLSSAWNLTGLQPGLSIKGMNSAQLGGASNTPGANMANTSRIIFGASNVGLDLTHSSNIDIQNIAFSAPQAGGGPKVGILCGRVNDGPQFFTMSNVTIKLNTTGSSSAPSIGVYNAGCELGNNNNMFVVADLPWYTTTVISTFAVTSPYQTISNNPTSTSMNACANCSFISIGTFSAPQAPLYLDIGSYDNSFTNLYMRCSGTGNLTQYAIFARQTEGLAIQGRQENCGFAMHVMGYMVQADVHLLNATGLTGTTNYVVVDGTDGIAQTFAGNFLKIYDGDGRSTAFTAYRWNSPSDYIGENTFYGRSGSCDGGISFSAAIASNNALYGRNSCSGSAISGATGANQLMVPGGIGFQGGGISLPGSLLVDSFGDLTVGTGGGIYNTAANDQNIFATNGSNHNVNLVPGGTGNVTATKNFVATATSCTNGELALSAGWQSTGSATVTAAQGQGQTCSWTITTGTTTAANPTITDTLTNVLPSASVVCELNIHGGTHTAAAGEGFQQTTLSATAPIFTFNGTPTAGGTTYFVTRRCGP
jgi:hypothetical protein